MFARLGTALVALSCSTVALTGCTVSVHGTTEPSVSTHDLEQGTSDALLKAIGHRPDSLTCPGPLKAKVGETTRCVLTDGDFRAGVTVNVTAVNNGKALWDAQVDRQPLPGRTG